MIGFLHQASARSNMEKGFVHQLGYVGEGWEPRVTSFRCSSTHRWWGDAHSRLSYEMWSSATCPKRKHESRTRKETMFLWYSRASIPAACHRQHFLINNPTRNSPFFSLGLWELPRKDSKCDKSGRKLRILLWKPNSAAALRTTHTHKCSFARAKTSPCRGFCLATRRAPTDHSQQEHDANHSQGACATGSRVIFIPQVLLI